MKAEPHRLELPEITIWPTVCAIACLVGLSYLSTTDILDLAKWQWVLLAGGATGVTCQLIFRAEISKLAESYDLTPNDPSSAKPRRKP